MTQSIGCLKRLGDQNIIKLYRQFAEKLKADPGDAGTYRHCSLFSDLKAANNAGFREINLLTHTEKVQDGLSR